MLSDHKILLSRELMVDCIKNVINISEEIWKELEASSAVEAPLRIRPYYNNIIKNEDNQTLSIRWS
jgi:hypothetical protein